MSEPKKPGLLTKLKKRLGPKSESLEDTLDNVIEGHQDEAGAASLDGDARSMMRNVIGFADMRVKDLMVPRANIIAVDQEITMRALMAQFIEAGHSRLPVYRESLDDVAGMIHVKDFLRWMTLRGKRKKTKTSPETGLEIPAKELATTIKQHSSLIIDVLFVPPSMPAPDLLVKMKASHIHLAIVVDEYGGTDGIVSLEDLVEEIIGDISDEHDTDEEQADLKKIDDETYMADGQVEIAKLEQELHRELLAADQKDEADTLAGLVFEMAGRVPIRGEIIKHPSGIEFEIVDSDARRIKRVRIHAPEIKLESPEETGTG